MISPVACKIQDYAAEVIENRLCGNQLYVMVLKTHTPFQALPGQFVMLDLPETRFFFRRPFSVYDVTPDGDCVLYYKVVGQGTHMMSEWPVGIQTKVLGPLGNSFQPFSESETTLLIGGGIGIAPLIYAAKMSKVNQHLHCFYGVRSEADIGLREDLMSVFQNLTISTDDGSYGESGNVCQALEKNKTLVAQASRALICGPTPMMAAATRLLSTLNPSIKIEVSLEEHMPCGTGACSGCVTFRTDQLLPSKVCIEGPVFDGRVIDWSGGKAMTGEKACV